jgi:asparagine synthase (glutamine-hydrolysing)
MIRAAQAIEHIAASEIAVEQVPFRSDLCQAALIRSSPFDHHMNLVGAVYALSQSAGCNVVLDGVSADVVLDPRSSNARLLRRGNVRAVWRSCQAEHDFYGRGPSGLRLFASAARTALAQDWMKTLRRRVLLRLNRRQFTSYCISEDLAREVDLAERLDLRLELAPNATESYISERASAILHPNLIVARERYDRVAASYGIEARDPFLDQRLLRFSLSLPPPLLMSGGWTKLVLRQAVAGLLPEAVRWRRGRVHLGWRFNAAVRTGERELPYRLAALHTKELASILDPSLIRGLERPASSDMPDDQIKVCSLANWLEYVYGPLR